MAVEPLFLKSSYWQSEKPLHMVIRRRIHFGTEKRSTPQPQKEEKLNGDQEDCTLSLKPALSPDEGW
jgi:hypothetical protein